MFNVILYLIPHKMGANYKFKFESELSVIVLSVVVIKWLKELPHLKSNEKFMVKLSTNL